jgi:hypothetical protein
MLTLFGCPAGSRPAELFGGAGSGDRPADRTSNVVEVLGQGVSIDWTRLDLEVAVGANGASAQMLEATEQLARRSIEAAYQQSVGSVRVTADARVADLVADVELGDAIRSRISRWEVTEATYHTGGAVDLRAELSLQELLRPWAIQIARPGVLPADGVTPGAGPSGVVVDARGTGLRPAYVVRLVSIDGQVLYGGELWEESAVAIPPFLFVGDPAHPGAAIAGERPAFVVATAVRDGDLVVNDRGREQLALAEGALGRITVVVVVDGG